VNLLRQLKQFDKHQLSIFVSAIPNGGIFQTKNGRKFQKLSLVRKRYRCKELSTGDVYLFSPIIEVYNVEAL
jgi:hypothetical protein